VSRPPPSPPSPGGRLLEGGSAVVTAAIGASLPWIMRRALRRGLAGIWSFEEAPLPSGGAVVVANHHGWWDAYLAWAIADRHGHASGAIMDDAQLARFPFFRHVGAIPASAPRAAARHAAAGAWLLVFPEGRMSPPGPLGPTQPGAAAVARWARVPALPLAIRATLRGRERPEVYLRFGAPLEPGVDADRLRDALQRLLTRLDADVASAPDPEAPVPGYLAWWPDRGRGDERAARWRRWWGAA
jgi:1-acyl-sn-glycerol-3-phosphate acyltransferase